MLLRSGNIVAVPTETVYGLAAVATVPSAIAKVFEVKNRPADNPLICHFHNIEQVESWVTEIPAPALKLMKRYSPGPISFMLDLPDHSPLKFATCGSNQVIVRIPNHPLLLSIIKEVDLPIAAPSANTSGKVSPTTAEMVEHDLGSKIAGIVDGGPAAVGLESTILDARSETQIVILRPGYIGKNEIEQVLPESRIVNSDLEGESNVPGSKYRHYAPDMPLFLIEHPSDIKDDGPVALILQQEQYEYLLPALKSGLEKPRIHFLVMGSLLKLDELAKNFYSTLADLNKLGVSKAYFLDADFGTTSLGIALRNRLNRIISPGD